MRISKQGALLIIMGICLISAMGLNVGETTGESVAGEGRRRGFCILPVPVGLVADAITGDCNWNKRNDIEWTIEPTIRDGEFIASGKMKADSPRVSWQASNALTSRVYYPPFQIYADCNSTSSGAILPPLSGSSEWTDLDPADAIAREWTIEGRSFLIRTPVPTAWVTLENLELHVHSGSGGITSIPLSVAKIKRE